MTPRIRWRALLGGAALIGLLVWRLRPTPLTVETLVVTSGPLRETIAAEGMTRVHDRYTLAAPVTGRLTRLPHRVGDSISPGALVAVLEPVPLDARSRQQAAAQVEAATDAGRTANAAVGAARIALDLAERERIRAESLAAGGHLPRAQQEDAAGFASTRRRELEVAITRAESAGHELERAQAALLAADAEGRVPPTGRTRIHAPVGGRILRLLEESERVVLAGTPLLELGDPTRLEVVADLLSTDAVRVTPGDTVLVEEWGGDRSLRAAVRLVEPSGFTKVSALGIEEQRVNVIADLREAPGPLGDRYRVEVRVVLWGAAQVLRVPLSAVIAREQGWAVYLVRDGRARLAAVKLGHRGGTEAEVLDGVSAGDTILRYPSNRVTDGVRVRSGGA